MFWYKCYEVIYVFMYVNPYIFAAPSRLTNTVQKNDKSRENKIFAPIMNIKMHYSADSKRRVIIQWNRIIILFYFSFKIILFCDVCVCQCVLWIINTKRENTAIDMKWKVEIENEWKLARCQKMFFFLQMCNHLCEN